MNFIAAIQHASIGYGIKRESMQQFLCLESQIKPNTQGGGIANHYDQLVFVEVGQKPIAYKEGTPIKLELEDYQANDWEVL